MALEVWNSGSRVEVLNANWPLDTDPLNDGDDHIRLLKTVVKNLLADLLSGAVVVKSATNATNATTANNSAQLGSVAAANYALTWGTYASLRAQGTTKADVGLSAVGNYGITDSIYSASSTTYASANAARIAALSTSGISTAFGAVKTYVWAKPLVKTNTGDAIAGGHLTVSTGTLPGTWRNMGYNVPDSLPLGLYYRIS